MQDYSKINKFLISALTPNHQKKETKSPSTTHRGRPRKYATKEEAKEAKRKYSHERYCKQVGKDPTEPMGKRGRPKKVRSTDPKLLEQYSTIINVKNNIRRKLEVLKHYGGVCICCGESDVRLLTIDHTNNNGSNDRKENGSGFGIYSRIIKDKFPTDLQILCWNCNCGRAGNFNICPHRDDGIITVNNIEKLLEKKLNRMAPDWKQII